MKTANAWDVYLKIKEISAKYSSGKPQIHVDSLAQELNLKKEMMREYIAALSILEFVEFADHTNDVITITDLGRS